MPSAPKQRALADYEHQLSGFHRAFEPELLRILGSLPGLEPLNMTTQAIDRQAPFGEAEHALLQSYLEEVENRVTPYLEASLLEELRRLSDPKSPQNMLREPHLTMTWLNVLALGRKPSH